MPDNRVSDEGAVGEVWRASLSLSFPAREKESKSPKASERAKAAAAEIQCGFLSCGGTSSSPFPAFLVLMPSEQMKEARPAPFLEKSSLTAPGVSSPRAAEAALLLSASAMPSPLSPAKTENSMASDGETPGAASAMNLASAVFSDLAKSRISLPPLKPSSPRTDSRAAQSRPPRSLSSAADMVSSFPASRISSGVRSDSDTRRALSLVMPGTPRR